MIDFVRQRLLRVQYQYTDTLDQYKAQRLLWIAEAVFVAALAWMPLQIIPGLARQQPVDPTLVSGLAITFISSIINVVLIQNGHLRIANWLMVLPMALVGVIGISGWPDGSADISGTFVILIILPVVAAGVLLSRRGILLVGLSLIAIIIVGAITQGQDFVPQTQIPSNLAGFDATVSITSIFVTMILLLMFSSNLQHITTQSLNIVQQQRQISGIGQELAQLEDEAGVMSQGLKLVRAQFDHLMVAIYLVDKNGNLHDSRQTESHQERRLTTDASILGEAGRTKQIATTSIYDAVAGRNGHLLASASYAAALPILDGQILLGVLDIQSPKSLVSFELDAMMVFTNQVALALRQARLVTNLRQSLRDQEKTVQQLQSQLRNHSRQSRNQVGDIWSTYARGHGAIAFGFDVTGENPEPVPANDLPANLAHVLASGSFHIEYDNGEQIINVPIHFRDHQLGAMSFAVPEGQALNQRQIETARIIADRLAIALENTRLFEQSRDQALRERKASEVTAQLISATDVREVLNRAAEQFKDALGAINTQIYIQPDMLLEPLAPLEQEDWQ